MSVYIAACDAVFDKKIPEQI